MKLLFNIESGHLTMSDEDGRFAVPLFPLSPAQPGGKTPQQLIDSFLGNIVMYGEVARYTYGQTAILDVIAISALIYRVIISGRDKGLRVLEVGSRFGCSTVFTALALKALSEDSRLFCLDTWQGNESGSAGQIDNYINALEYFRGLMRFIGLADLVRPVVCDPVAGMEALRDDYFDVVLLDAAPNFKNAWAHISNAVRLVRPGGLLMGQGCGCKMSQLPEEMKIILMDADEPGCLGDYNGGVIKALRDAFGEDYERFAPGQVWYKTVSAEDKRRLSVLQPAENHRNMIIDAGNHVRETLASASLDSLELLCEAYRWLDQISGYLNNNFSRLVNREIKSVTMLLKNYLAHTINALQNSLSGVAEKYLSKARSLCPEWHRMTSEEFAVK